MLIKVLTNTQYSSVSGPKSDTISKTSGNINHQNGLYSGDRKSLNFVFSWDRSFGDGKLGTYNPN